MNKEKKIADLTKELEMGKSYPYITNEREMAERLVTVGYGNVKKEVKEFMDKVKEKFYKRISELKIREEECIKVRDFETASRCNVAYTEIKNVFNEFEKLIKERFGE